MRRHGELRRPESRLLQAVIFQDSTALEALLQQGSDLGREVLEFEDEYGYTCCLWCASRGHHKLLKALINLGANPLHVAHGGKTDATTALHVCAATGRFGSKSDERKGYLECASLLLAAGANAFAENSKGMTAVDVAVHHGNVALKAYLEYSAIFRGSLFMPVVKVLGGTEWHDRHCVVQPRVPWDAAVLKSGGPKYGTGTPVLWLMCYKSAKSMRPICQIPLTGARLEMQQNPESEQEVHAMLIIPSKSVHKGVLVAVHIPEGMAIEVIGSADVLREMAFLFKSVQLASDKGTLGELCRAAMMTNLKQQQSLMTSFSSSSAGLDTTPSGSLGWLSPKGRTQSADTPKSANGSGHLLFNKDLMASQNSTQSIDPAFAGLPALHGPSYSLNSNLSEQEGSEVGSTLSPQASGNSLAGSGRAEGKGRFSSSLSRSRRSINMGVAGIGRAFGRRQKEANGAALSGELGHPAEDSGDLDQDPGRAEGHADGPVTGIVERPLRPGEEGIVRTSPAPRMRQLLAQVVRRPKTNETDAAAPRGDDEFDGVPGEAWEAAEATGEAERPQPAPPSVPLLQQIAKRLHLSSGAAPNGTSAALGHAHEDKAEGNGAQPSVEELLEQWRASQGTPSQANVRDAPVINPEFWGEPGGQPGGVRSRDAEVLPSRGRMAEEEAEDFGNSPQHARPGQSAGLELASEQMSLPGGSRPQQQRKPAAIGRSIKSSKAQTRSFTREKGDSTRPRVTTEVERLEAAQRLLERKLQRALKQAAKEADEEGSLRPIPESPAASSAGSVFDSTSADSDEEAMYEEELRILREQRSSKRRARLADLSLHRSV